MKTDNELIAEFMGLIKHPKKPSLFYARAGGSPSISSTRHSGMIGYETSWDALIPVVEKIEAIGYDTEIRCISHVENGERVINVSCSIETWNGKEVVQNYNLVKIYAVYGAVVEFIKWYNSTPEQHG